ncbi:polyprenol monophosphomannose synthase [Candidatus Sumerlaeota bacterium]|nr:polyprenol monophosphomannose synthase [Candidatus Sumerlaeota bacterium]
MPTNTTDTSPRVAVILPTYNEAENIIPLIEAVLQQDADREFTVVVVDDNSPDGTAELVRDAMQSESRLDLITRAGKLGLGTAYIAGYRRALERGCEWILSMDADWSHNPEHIPEILSRTGGADMVIGSRYVAGGGLRDWPMHRKLLSAAANRMARAVLRIKTRDCTSGYRCYRAEFLRKIPLDEITSDGYSFLIDLLYRFIQAEARIAESPILFTDRKGGVSKISKTEIFKALKTLWTLYFHHA